MSIPISQFVPPSLTPGNHKFVFYTCNSISVSKVKSPLINTHTHKHMCIHTHTCRHITDKSNYLNFKESTSTY